MTEGELRTVQVDFGGLMEVMGKNLYSTPMVAVRELVQNAHDSCTRRRLEADEAEYTPRITVRGLGAVLEIEDNGAGLTRQEIFDYLATIGAGYTRKLRAAHASWCTRHASRLLPCSSPAMVRAMPHLSRVRRWRR